VIVAVAAAADVAAAVIGVVGNPTLETSQRFTPGRGSVQRKLPRVNRSDELTSAVSATALAAAFLHPHETTAGFVAAPSPNRYGIQIQNVDPFPGSLLKPTEPPSMSTMRRTM